VRRWQRKRPRSRRRQGLRGWLSVELLCVCSVDFRHDSRSDVRRAVNKQTTQLPRKNQPILPRKRKRKAENRKPGRKFSKYHDKFFFVFCLCSEFRCVFCFEHIFCVDGGVFGVFFCLSAVARNIGCSKRQPPKKPKNLRVLSGPGTNRMRSSAPAHLFANDKCHGQYNNMIFPGVVCV